MIVNSATKIPASIDILENPANLFAPAVFHILETTIFTPSICVIVPSQGKVMK